MKCYHNKMFNIVKIKSTNLFSGIPSSLLRGFPVPIATFCLIGKEILDTTTAAGVLIFSRWTWSTGFHSARLGIPLPKFSILAGVPRWVAEETFPKWFDYSRTYGTNAATSMYSGRCSSSSGIAAPPFGSGLFHWLRRRVEVLKSCIHIKPAGGTHLAWLLPIMPSNRDDAMIVVTDFKLWLACQGIAFWSLGFSNLSLL